MFDVNDFAELKYKLLCIYEESPIDEYMRSWCNALNRFPNIVTIACCDGHRSTKTREGIYPYIYLAINDKQLELRRAMYGMDALYSTVDAVCGVDITNVECSSDFITTTINITIPFDLRNQAMETLFEVLITVYKDDVNKYKLDGCCSSLTFIEVLKRSKYESVNLLPARKVLANMKTQLELFNVDDNPHILENMNSKLSPHVTAIESGGRFGMTHAPIRNRLEDVVWHIRIHIDTIRNGSVAMQHAHADDARVKLTENLWNKDGSQNTEFVKLLEENIPGIVIQFEDDHDLNQKRANVFIPGISTFEIIGKKGSC